ncbi:MAG TPA: peptidylprolyl isomerase [Planctomycetota bacterium]|nr:peptidylprolyl isomerase [Planctomycetota bacterium]
MGAWILGLLAGLTACGTSKRPDPYPSDLLEGRGRPGDEAVVALLDGRPLTWRVVAEKMLEVDPRTAVETYVRWKVVEDRRAEMGIAHAEPELRRRAEAYAERTRATLGEEAFRRRLEAEGMTEAAWTARLAGSSFLAQLLTLDKIVRYQGWRDGLLTVDRVLFAREADARDFAESARNQGFDRVLEDMEKRFPEGARRLARETFARTAPPTDPELDEAAVARVWALEPGRTSEPLPGPGFWSVVRVAERREGREGTWAEARAEVTQDVLARPPAPGEYQDWLSRELARRRIEYPAPARGK